MSGEGFRVEPYEARHRALWDRFVAGSRNGTFLLQRGFLEYHAERFADASLLCWEGGRLAAVLPASQHERDGAREVRSHGGLTYGGLISDAHLTANDALRVVEALCAHWRGAQVQRVLLKPVPHLYHRMPAEEELYAYTRFGARLVRRDIAAALWREGRAPLTKGRKWSVKQALGRGPALRVERSTDFAEFLAMEAALLAEKYGVAPVHSAPELALLAERFPERVRLHVCRDEAGALLAGTLLFVEDRVAHAQYISSTAEGRAAGALDRLFHALLEETYAHLPWFDFGISTEDSGRVLNTGLASNKESWGARGVCYDHYELAL